MEIKQYIQENEERFLNELFSLIRIPSISALPAHKDDMLACAERWRQLLLEAGADEAMVMPSEGHPLVYAEKRVSPDAPTVLVLHIMTSCRPNRWNYGKASLSNRKFVTVVSGHAVPTMIKDSP